MTDLPHMERVTNEQDYIFIKNQSLAWIVAIEKEIKDGKTPEEIRDGWGEKYKREKMALRIYHAAQHIKRERQGDE